MKTRTARMLTVFGALVSAAMVAAWSVASSAQGASRSSSSGVVVIESNLGYEGGQGAGTGMVLTSDGEILTNNHVVSGATSIRVIVPGTDKSYSAKVVGYSETNDVAVIKASGASGLDTISRGDSSKVAVGDAVTALGNAGGTGSLTPAPGHVTGLDRSITASDETGDSEQLSGLIETDANVQPGDSGGPLLDRSGRVIGMDSAASTGNQFAFGNGDSGGADGFAIPIDHALAIVHQIESGDSTSTVHVGGTAFLGVQVEAASAGGSGGDQSGGYGYDPYGGGGGYGYDPYGYGGGDFGYDPYGYGYDPNGGSSQGSSATTQTTGGAVIAGTVQGGPAERAGLSEGDTITAVDSHTISSPDDLTTVLATKRPGDKVGVGYVDQNGSSQTVTITLGSGPAK